MVNIITAKHQRASVVIVSVSAYAQSLNELLASLSTSRHSIVRLVNFRRLVENVCLYHKGVTFRRVLNSCQ